MTTKRHPENEKAKRNFLQFLRDVKGRDESSIDQVAKALERFDDYNRRRDFGKFHIQQARGFKAHLMAQRNIRTGEPLSASTVVSTLGMLKAFFIWLSGEAGYSRVKQADAEYFNPPDNLARVATARRHKPCASLKQIRAVLDAMPTATEIERRDRALVAFTILTGARDRAIVSFRLKDIDLEHELLEQDARHARTKGAKTFTTWFFPVGADIQKIVVDWVTFLRSEKGFGPEDPIFPRRTSATARTRNFARTVWSARLGRTPTPSARSSRRPLQGRACPISTRTAFEIRSSSWPMNSNLRLNSSRRGRKILDMTTA